MILVIIMLIAMVYYIIDLFIKVSMSLSQENSSGLAMLIFNLIIVCVCAIGGYGGFLIGVLLCGFIDLMIVITKETPVEQNKETIKKQNEYTQEYGLIENENEWW